MRESLIACVIGISLEIGNGFVRTSASMKLSHRLAAFAFVALLLPGLRASAQASSGDEFEQDDSKPKPKADKSSEETAPAGDAATEPAAKTTKAALPAAPAPEPASENPYVPFAPPPASLRIEA
ncbi:MAG TPA: hypothetical protein VGP64_04480, partial [Polyangia bacterium]